MIGRRKSPDGLPFRLYKRESKFKVSYWYKLPARTWAFCISAQANNPAAVAEIQQAQELNGDTVKSGTLADLIGRYFTWQKALKLSDARRKAASTLDENKIEARQLISTFGAMLSPSLSRNMCTPTRRDARIKALRPRRIRKWLCYPQYWNRAAPRANWRPTLAVALSTPHGPAISTSPRKIWIMRWLKQG